MKKYQIILLGLVSLWMINQTFAAGGSSLVGPSGGPSNPPEKVVSVWWPLDRFLEKYGSAILPANQMGRAHCAINTKNSCLFATDFPRQDSGQNPHDTCSEDSLLLIGSLPSCAEVNGKLNGLCEYPVNYTRGKNGVSFAADNPQKSYCEDPKRGTLVCVRAGLPNDCAL